MEHHNDAKRLSCERCGYTTSRKSDILKHFRRRVPCEPEYSNKAPSELLDCFQRNLDGTTCQCPCGKHFKSVASRRHHMSHHCHLRVTQADSNGPTVTVTELNQQLAELRMQVKSMKELIANGSGNNNTINSHNNIGQQINNIVTINAFGRESTEHLTPQFIEQCVRRRDVGLIQLLKELHFNQEVPENHNIKIASLKRGEMQVYDGERWSYRPQDRVVSDMISTGHGIMQDHFDDNENEIRERVRQNLFEHIQKWLDGVHNDEQKYVRPLVRDVLSMIKTYATRRSAA
jgi:hypothetical protein